MDQPSLRRILLDLTDPVRAARTGELTREDWRVLDAMAEQHRLQPLLHGLHRDDPEIPGDVRAGWASAFRTASIVAMAHHAELAETIALLEARGFAPIALKGAFLAWHCYPDPALRPMRDLDLLMQPETIIPAFECLLAAGYVLADEPEMPLADIVRLDKHMPPLRGPRQTHIELHHRLFEPCGRLDHKTPARTLTASGNCWASCGTGAMRPGGAERRTG